ncbi:ParB/RepB/Spo0J family partition protein [Candidatus Uhrbacteria bacterium]|nr:ParB/RepB/Spo0J family partition protein [Candidatus Uhrbacteria bacterium]
MSLGKGLGSLIPTKGTAPRAIREATSGVAELPIAQIQANRHQPRHAFADSALKELADSIKKHGILQPIIVTRQDKGFELVSGERRHRAAKLAGLATLPALVRDAGALERLELALIENIQREDLNAIERATAYTKLMKEFGLTQEEAAARLGKPRSAVANTVRLLTLPDDIQKALADGRIVEAHAKILAGIDDAREQRAAFEKVVTHGLTVRETEGMVKKLVRVRGHTRKVSAHRYIEIEEKLTARFGTKVRVRPQGRGGQITIDFYSDEELHAILKKIS